MNSLSRNDYLNERLFQGLLMSQQIIEAGRIGYHDHRPIPASTAEPQQLAAKGEISRFKVGG
ncbi:hypothetical protein [Alsobacter sp. R-9]